SLDYCQKNKGLVIYAYCLMPSHCHMICSTEEGFELSSILRDLKKFTSKQIISTINEYPESRRGFKSLQLIFIWLARRLQIGASWVERD
ncbi:MAG: transposase, partial [Salinivirgaceae bacterium]|nr:transposase [Salinivirgaceae bacterium]